ncbi:MAG: hypothetical protein HY923_01055 [Elusimicrobia bacterium]|nr:hypothetical protein [Elusimicrobiota bacterium]
MSDDRIEALERTVRRVVGEVLRQGERLARLEEGSKKLAKLDELDQRVTDFAEDVEAARRERGIADQSFRDLRKELQRQAATLISLGGKNVDDDAR